MQQQSQHVSLPIPNELPNRLLTKGVISGAMLLIEEDERIEPDTLWKELIVSATVRQKIMLGLEQNVKYSALLAAKQLVICHFVTKFVELPVVVDFYRIRRASISLLSNVDVPRRRETKFRRFQVQPNGWFKFKNMPLPKSVP